jgi:hypothetical protein
VIVQLKKIFSETIWPNYLKFGRKHLWKVLYKVFSNLPEMLPTKFLFIWPSGFRGEDFLEIGDQPETRIVCGGHVCNKQTNSQKPKKKMIELKWYMNTHWMLPTIFSSLCQRQCELLPSLGVRRQSSCHVVRRKMNFLESHIRNIPT